MLAQFHMPSKKNILVITYSQTGQTNDIAERILAPFRTEDVYIHYEKIWPKTAFPFPWSGREFFDAMPETVKEIPMELQPDNIPENVAWDLILLGYQPWFLSVCRPISSFLQSEKAARIFKNTSVVTFLGCRNMFVNAQEKMKRRLHAISANHVGQIALTDKSGNLVSLVTILAWMLKGVREGYLGIFPRSGVSVQDTQNADRFGKIILEKLNSGSFDGLQDELLQANAVDIRPNLLIMESRGAKNFKFWAGFISAKGGQGDPNRFGRLKLFSILLPTAIVILSPITTLLKWVISIVKRKKLRSEAEYFKSISYRGYEL